MACQMVVKLAKKESSLVDLKDHYLVDLMVDEMAYLMAVRMVSDLVGVMVAQWESLVV